MLTADSADVPATGGMWKRSGFIRHAPEYCLLAKVILERVQTEQALPLTDRLPVDSGHQGGQRPVLDKYDETSMSQINQLITSFQDMEIMMQL